MTAGESLLAVVSTINAGTLVALFFRTGRYAEKVDRHSQSLADCVKALEDRPTTKDLEQRYDIVLQGTRTLSDRLALESRTINDRITTELASRTTRDEIELRFRPLERAVDKMMTRDELDAKFGTVRHDIGAFKDSLERAHDLMKALMEMVGRVVPQSSPVGALRAGDLHK